MSNNNAAALGVTAVNKSRQIEVEGKAQALIGQILAAQKSVAGYQKAIGEEQVKLNELALDVIDQRTVIGAEFGSPLNPNQATILNAIKKLNDARQETVSTQSQTHINRIEGYKQTIASLEKQIADGRKLLAELAVDVVTVESVVGSVAR